MPKKYDCVQSTQHSSVSPQPARIFAATHHSQWDLAVAHVDWVRKPPSCVPYVPSVLFYSSQMFQSSTSRHVFNLGLFKGKGQKIGWRLPSQKAVSSVNSTLIIISPRCPRVPSQVWSWKRLQGHKGPQPTAQRCQFHSFMWKESVACSLI